MPWSGHSRAMHGPLSNSRGAFRFQGRSTDLPWTRRHAFFPTRGTTRGRTREGNGEWLVSRPPLPHVSTWPFGALPTGSSQPPLANPRPRVKVPRRALFRWWGAVRPCSFEVPAPEGPDGDGRRTGPTRGEGLRRRPHHGLAHDGAAFRGAVGR